MCLVSCFFPRRALAAAVLLLAAAAPSWAQQNIDTGQALVTLSASAAGVYPSADQSNVTNRSLVCFVSLTSVATAQVTVSVQGKDKISGTYYNLATTPALIGGSATLTVGAGVAPGAWPDRTQAIAGIWPDRTSVVASYNLPGTWRVVATVLGTTSSAVTGTVGCSAIE